MSIGKPTFWDTKACPLLRGYFYCVLYHREICIYCRVSNEAKYDLLPISSLVSVWHRWRLMHSLHHQSLHFKSSHNKSQTQYDRDREEVEPWFPPVHTYLRIPCPQSIPNKAIEPYTVHHAATAPFESLYTILLFLYSLEMV